MFSEFTLLLGVVQHSAHFQRRICFPWCTANGLCSAGASA